MNSTTNAVGWTSEPNGRGTTGLIWSCFATTFLCTWSAIHPNLPGQSDSEWRIFWRRIGYLVMCLLVPELFVGLALDQFFDAKELQSMSPSSNRWSLKKCFFLSMGGFVFETKSDDDIIRRRLDIKDLHNLLKTEQLPWPEVEDCDFSDRSKSDWFLKSLALVQILWFTTQIAGRAAQGLAVTTLELFTLGIVFCAICIYSLWWAKPFDVRQPIIIEDKTGATSSKDSCVRNGLHRSIGRTKFNLLYTILAIIIVVFGGIHVAAWQFHFPTHAERLIWRVCSIGITVLPIIMGLHGYYLDNDSISAVLLLSYLVVRLYMFVEMFVALRSVPASVYKTPEWSNYFPTIG